MYKKTRGVYATRNVHNLFHESGVYMVEDNIFAPSKTHVHI